MPVLLFITALTMVSCDGLLNVDSEQYTYDEQYRMGSENDSLYAYVGILSKLQLLGDRYVLLGELRGELMKTGDNASRFLKEINEFNVTKENPYASVGEYYDVINNCNYVIQYVDTAASADGIKYNVKVMSMAKAVRAWTYLQLVLNYGEAKYIVKPILTKDDVTKTYPTVDLAALCDLLIDDLLPFFQRERIGTLNPGQFGSFESRYSLISIRFLLGDLYLWKGSILEGKNDTNGAKSNYAKAANMYYNMMVQQNFLVSRENATTWTFVNELPTTVEGNNDNWSKVYSTGLTESISVLASSSEYGKQFSLDSLSFNNKILPTDIAVSYWDDQIYLHTKTELTTGDLRKRGSIATEFRGSDMKTYRFDEPIITKFLRAGNESHKLVTLYRNSLLYLRYAEAVNRLGCSNLSFAALKSGLNRTIDANATIQTEILANMVSIPSYMTFTGSTFNRTPTGSSLLLNIGIHARGCGFGHAQTDPTLADTTYYRIPYGVVDSAAVVFVEDKIVEELALEAAFEGNRFHDLMRVAIRRNDPAYLAERVSAKYSNKAAMKTKLMNMSSWYLPK